MKQKTIKAPNINSPRKRYRTNHCVAEKEVYHHHLIVYSKPKALEGLGTDQVVKENLKVNNLIVYWTWFLLSAPLIQKITQNNIKKASVKMICKILCLLDTPQDILRKESNTGKIFVNDAICYFSNKSPQRLESAQFLQSFSSFYIRKCLSTQIFFVTVLSISYFLDVTLIG